MIEFHIRMCVDTQDVEQAYDELQASLQFIGHTCYIRDNWMRNNAPLPADVAQRVAYAWQKNRETMCNKGIIFATHDPAFTTKMLELIEQQEREHAPKPTKSPY